MSNNNNKINNTQRKVFANLAEDLFEKKQSRARTEYINFRAEVIEQVRQELGVTKIEKQIKELENQLSALRERKSALGFMHNDGNFRQG